MKIIPSLLLAILIIPATGCGARGKCSEPGNRAVAATVDAARQTDEHLPVASPMVRKLVDAGIEQTNHTKHYDPSYTRIAYPGGDVPLERGVCSDVVVRALRACGIDLQKEVHEDMARNFPTYPKRWGLSAPDPNIDHRRVPNLMTYFTRQGESIPVTSNAEDYLPGDVVVWDLGGGILHIGLLTDIRANETRRIMVVHNIGAGARVEDVLFAWKVIGHYRVLPFSRG
jgi:uncharacterized protein YijF (DUF1287 family)